METNPYHHMQQFYHQCSKTSIFTQFHIFCYNSLFTWSCSQA